MSDRDRDARGQGASPYDEPTETFRVPQTPPGPDETGAYGYEPYRRDADATEAVPAAPTAADRDRPAGATGSTHDSATTSTRGGATASTRDGATASTGDGETARIDTADAATAPPTAAIPVDRDAFHREHNRRAAYSDDDATTGRRPSVYDADPSDDPLDDDAATQAYSARSRRLDDDDELDSKRGRFSRSRKRGGRADLDDELARAQAAQRRGTTDLGLLALRVAVGLIAMAHGAQKLFGWWNGPRLSGFEDFLVNSANTNIGFNPDAAKPLAIVGALSETIGGLMLVLGVLTPIAGSAVLGVMIIAATYKATLAGGVWFFASGQSGPGVEYELFLGVAAAAIILAGPGRISLDFGRGWATRPFVGSVAWLVVGIAAPVAIWILFNGTNPFQSPGNPTG